MIDSAASLNKSTEWETAHFPFFMAVGRQKTNETVVSVHDHLTEEMYLVVFVPMPVMMQIFIGFCAFCYFWGWVKNTFMLLNIRNAGHLFTLWESITPDSELWPSIRQTELAAATKSVMNGVAVTLGILVAPMMLGCLLKLFWTKTLFLPTAFASDVFDLNANFGLVLYQCITVFFLEYGWCMFEYFLFLMINLILAEFKFLNAALGNIFMSQDLAYIGKYQTPRNFVRVRKQLCLWIKHHANVLKFMKEFARIYSPILAAQYLYIIINMCGLLFCSASGQIPGESAFYCYIFIAGFMLMTLRLCRCGDGIVNLNERLATNVPRHMCELPIDILKNLKIILETTKKPPVIAIRGIMAIESPSFRKMMFLQYRFYRFFADMH